MRIQVGSHYHFAETNPALAFDRTAARGQRHAQRREIVRRDDRAECAARGVAFADADERERVRHQAVEDVVAVAEIGVGGVREAAIHVGLRAVLVEHADQLADPSRHRLQQQRVDDGEGGGVGADAQPEHEHGDGGKAGRPEKKAEAVTQILQK